MGHRIAIGAPKRGEKRELVEHAERNARQSLSRRLAEAASQGKLLAALGKSLGIDTPIRRVEVFDNSHIMGTNAIGAMIVAGPDGFVKNQYRTFNIKSETLTPGDDYGMMREVLARRFAKLAKGAPPSPEGGGTEGGGTKPVLDSHDPSPPSPLPPGEAGDRIPRQARPRAHRRRPRPVGGCARDAGGVRRVRACVWPRSPRARTATPGRETFFIAGREPFRLPERDPALFFAQRLRDEAHRFAIGTHRAKRKREFVKSPLDEIPGIGPSRKRALLHAFGTAKEVARAGLADLIKTPGLNAATAKLVYEFFHEGGRVGREPKIAIYLLARALPGENGFIFNGAPVVVSDILGLRDIPRSLER